MTMNSKILDSIQKLNCTPVKLPINKKEVENCVDIIFSQLFPICENVDKQKTEKLLLEVYDILVKNISNVLEKEKAEACLETFFENLCTVRKSLNEDAQAFFENDPAAESLEEIILAYPGFFALTVYRISHELYKLNIPIIPRLFSEYAHNKTGIDIHPGAKIGRRLFLDHGTGIVIGETTTIGDDVKIYQGVTLGALHVDKNMKKQKRHPNVENNVVIYAGATILGGKTTIGGNSTIGGSVWLTQSIEPNSLVYYKPEIKIKTTNS